MTLRGSILSNHTTVRKLHLERTDILKMIEGISLVMPRPSNMSDSTVPDVHFRRSIRDSLNSRDSHNSSVVINQVIMQELQDLRDEMEMMRGSTIYNSVTSIDSNDPASSSTRSSNELALLRKKVNASEQSFLSAMEELRQQLAVAEAELETVKITVSNLTTAVITQETPDNAAFSSMQLTQVTEQVDSLRHVIGMNAGTSNTSLVDQIRILSTRFQTIRNDINELRVSSEDTSERLDKLEENSNGHIQVSASPQDTEENDVGMVYTQLLDLKSELDDTKRKLTSELNDQTSQFTNRVSELESSMDNVTQRVENLNSEGMMQRNKTLQMDTRLTKVEKQLSEVETVKTRIDNTMQSMRELEKQMEEMNEEIQSGLWRYGNCKEDG